MRCLKEVAIYLTYTVFQWFSSCHVILIFQIHCHIVQQTSEITITWNHYDERLRHSQNFKNSRLLDGKKLIFFKHVWSLRKICIVSMNFWKRQRTQRKQHSMKRSRLSFSSLLLFEVFCWHCLAVREVSDGCNYLGAPSALALTETESLSVLILHCFY